MRDDLDYATRSYDAEASREATGKDRDGNNDPVRSPINTSDDVDIQVT